MPRGGLRNFAMTTNIRRKVTTITILQNKVNSILSLQSTKTPNTTLLSTTINIIENKTKDKNKKRKAKHEKEKKNGWYDWYLDGLKKANYVRVIDGAENGNLFEQILTDFWVKLFPVNLFDSNH